MLKNQETISLMTLEEKVSLVSGGDMWHTQELPRINLKQIMMTDGPHGLRKVAENGIGGIYDSAKATCFPTAVLTACSWDEELLAEMTVAMAEEAKQEGISIVLGPGANIKRSPLCGRNFEYFSEDPLLSGKMAAAWIRGMESQGIGSSLKHFALNNQEYMRMTVSAEVDERTMREIYLKPFEIAVKEGKPLTVMCAYNKINGEYCSSNKSILTDILREEWGFKGLVMSDWGAVDDRAGGVEAGMDLEMPGSGGYYDNDIMEAIKSGKILETTLDKSVDRVLTIINKGLANKAEGYRYDIEKHERIAEKVALESAVLLKNDNQLLPINRADKVLVIGELAKESRYQGGGSSHISPRRVTTLLQGMTELGVKYDYVMGYSVNSDKGAADKRIIEAVLKASAYDKIILCVGLTDEYESEGFDRKHMHLPSVQEKLINKLIELKKHIAVVFYGGSPVQMDWESGVDSILAMYLGGQMGGLATAKLLYGEQSPCGKLAETFPIALDKTPCFNDYNYDVDYSFYTEGIYVGYRYYDTVNEKVLFPFGHGLSYNNYAYSNLKVDKIVDTCDDKLTADKDDELRATNGENGTASNDDKILVSNDDKLMLSVDITNRGDYDSKEIVQVYVSKKGGKIFTPIQELRAFAKVELAKGETKTVNIELDIAKLSYYDTVCKTWIVEGGEYEIRVGASSRDIRATANVTIQSNQTPMVSYLESWYTEPNGNSIPASDFIALRGYKLERKAIVVKKGKYTVENSLMQIGKTSGLARKLVAVIGFVLRRGMKVTKKDTAYLMMIEGLKSSPLKKLSASSQGAFSKDMRDALLVMLNGHFFKGLKGLLAANKTRKPLKI